MSPRTAPRTAVLMITLWLGDGDPQVVRARLTEVTDLNQPPRIYASAESAEGILRTTEEWIAKVRRNNPDSL